MVGDRSAGEYNLRVAQVLTLSLFTSLYELTAQSIMIDSLRLSIPVIIILFYVEDVVTQVERGDEGYYECQVQNAVSLTKT